MKVLFNNCFGGFSISKKALELYRKKKNIVGLEIKDEWDDYENYCCYTRTDETLIEVVEELGAEANGSCAELAIAEVPDGSYWHIDEYDGAEEIRYTLVKPPEEYGAKIVKVCKRK